MSLARTRPPRAEISNRLFGFYDWCARIDVPDVTRPARTIEAGWPQIFAVIDAGITNGPTEATNRMIKDAPRIAFGFRNLHKDAPLGKVALQSGHHQSAIARVTSPLKFEEPPKADQTPARPTPGVTPIERSKKRIPSGRSSPQSMIARSNFVQTPSWATKSAGAPTTESRVTLPIHGH